MLNRRPSGAPAPSSAPHESPPGLIRRARPGARALTASPGPAHDHALPPSPEGRPIYHSPVTGDTALPGDGRRFLPSGARSSRTLTIHSLFRLARRRLPRNPLPCKGRGQGVGRPGGRGEEVRPDCRPLINQSISTPGVDSPLPRGFWSPDSGYNPPGDGHNLGCGIEVECKCEF